MADVDFIALYQQLGFAPSDGVDELRRAWRRRVAQLHPDRTGRDVTDELQRLNAAYAAAMRFHARYGRLPGETPGAAPHAAPRTPVAPRSAPARHPHAHWLLVFPLLALATAWLVERPDRPAPAPAPAASETARRGAAVPARLRLGLSGEEVLAMLGEPVSRNATLWQWGPSWVAFECGLVVDWYSSRLRPLKAATDAPTELDRRAAPPRPRCPALPSPRPGAPS